MSERIVPPRIMVAAPQGRSGKTVLSIGLAAMLRKGGLSVQAFKKGPDYIDSSWLSAATGRPCRNLDQFLTGEEVLKRSFEEASCGADFAFIEGNMGLYDSVGEDGLGSSADCARLLATPVVLVVNTARMTRSVAAMVRGFQLFEPDTPIAGVILNSVAGARHRAKLRAAIERYCSVPVIGCIPRDQALNIKERHLGLVPFREDRTGALAVERVMRCIEKEVDVDFILSIGRTARALPAAGGPEHGRRPARVRIGVVLDRAFHFYYPENLEALEREGAELVFIDAMADRTLPGVDGLYIGGGFPELYLEELSDNRSLMEEIRNGVEAGMAVYAECAGLMYLCEEIRQGDRSHRMAGVIPAGVQCLSRPQGHGYVEASVQYENPFYPVGMVVRGHEFHHSSIDPLRGVYCALRLARGKGINGREDGIVYKNLFASYTHIHAAGTPGWAPAFVNLAARTGTGGVRYDREEVKEVTHG